MTRARLILAIAASAVLPALANAQSGSAPQSRPALEQQLRARVAAVTRARLKLDDAQMAKLESVNARVAPQLAALVTQERQTRQKLRAQLKSASPDEAQVSALLDGLLRLQKQRISLLESEQKDLSKFLTPSQRAKYMALQAQIRRRADQLRARAKKQPRG